MGINGVGYNSAVSWAQFVKVAHAARERNSGLSFDAAVKAQGAPVQQDAGAVSFKRVADVYSGSASAPAKNVYAQPSLSLLAEMGRKTVGGSFDAYA
jgi:hypothetical protein